jgi:MoaA/NifB/PqqE/SkfB family radical SAM enzyme
LAERLIDPANKILRFPDVLAAIRRGKRVWPLNVEMDLTNRCNARCQHCAFAYMRGQEVLPTTLAEDVLTEMRNGGLRAVTFTGGGEPTLHPDFARLAFHAAGLGLKVGVYTNGLRPDPLTETLYALTWVYLSLDAADPDSYREVKRVDSFWQVLDTARWLLTYREGDTPKVGLGFLLSGTNWREATVGADLAGSLGVDYCQFRPIVSADPAADYSWIREALPLLDALVSPRVYVSRARFVELLEGQARGYSLCRASELVPCVGADGTLWVCPNMRGKRSLGSLAEESFATLWARREAQMVGRDCRVACRDHALNETLEYVCQEGPHDAFV